MLQDGAGVWRVLGASVKGTRHLLRQAPCQDAHATCVLENGCLLIAVADGAGSCKRAEEGAQCAVAVGLQHLTPHLRQPLKEHECKARLEESLQAVRAALQEKAGTDPVADLSTTLLLLVVTPDWLGLLQVGDGAVVGCMPDGSLELLSQVEADPDHFINETIFVTSPDCVSARHLLVRPRGGLAGIAVCTDGVSHLAIRATDHRPYPGFYDHLFEFVRKMESTEQELTDFLNSTGVNDRTDDDKTLVIAALHAPQR